VTAGPYAAAAARAKAACERGVAGDVEGAACRAELRVLAWPELFALQVVLAAEPALSGPSTPGRASR
jgi:hypothetical protein